MKVKLNIKLMVRVTKTIYINGDHKIFILSLHFLSNFVSTYEAIEANQKRMLHAYVITKRRALVIKVEFHWGYTYILFYADHYSSVECGKLCSIFQAS